MERICKESFRAESNGYGDYRKDCTKKQLSNLDLRFQNKVVVSLEKFEKGKSVDLKKLIGRKNEYRMRVGHYRIILNKISNKEYLITKIGERENIYMVFF